MQTIQFTMRFKLPDHADTAEEEEAARQHAQEIADAISIMVSNTFSGWPVAYEVIEFSMTTQNMPDFDVVGTIIDNADRFRDNVITLNQAVLDLMSETAYEGLTVGSRWHRVKGNSSDTEGKRKRPPRRRTFNFLGGK